MSDTASPVIRALRLLEAVAQADGVTFSELMQVLGCPRATLARQLKDLTLHGYLRKDATTGHYHAGPATAALQGGSPRDRLQRLATPILAELSTATGQSAAVFWRDGDQIECLAKQMHPASLSMQEIGQRGPDFSTSPWGWWMWPELTAAQQDRMRPKQRDPKRLARRITRASLAAGWLLDDCTQLPHTRRLAAPVRDARGRMIACIGMAGMAAMLTDDVLATVGPALAQAAHSLSRQLGWNPKEKTP